MPSSQTHRSISLTISYGTTSSIVIVPVPENTALPNQSVTLTAKSSRTRWPYGKSTPYPAWRDPSVVSVLSSLLQPASAAPTSPVCKTVNGDELWPSDEVWRAELPGVTNFGVKANQPHPNYYFAAKDRGDVQAAVNFANRYNIRLTVISTGHDYLGRLVVTRSFLPTRTDRDRNDAPNGLLLSVARLKGVNVLPEFHAEKSGAREVHFSNDPVNDANKIRADSKKQAAVTFGAGVTTQELNDALEASGLFTLGAAEGSVAVAGGWVCLRR
jgi:hypothetical protein